MASMSRILKNWGILLGFLGASAAFVYPTFIYPITHIDEYKKIQSINRKGINQEEIQPGGMKVWSDPFGRK